MLVAVSDERIDIGKCHVVAAASDAGDRLEQRGRVIDGDVEPFSLEVALVLREENERLRPFEAPVQREFDAGLRRRRSGYNERERHGQQIGGPTYPGEI